MNQECLILGVGEHLVEKNLAGIPLRVQNISLAQAGIDEQSESERKIGVLREIFDGLRAAVFLKSEIVLGQIADDLSLLVPYCDRQSDHFDINRHSGRSLARRILTMRILAMHRQSEQKQGDKRNVRTKMLPHDSRGAH